LGNRRLTESELDETKKTNFLLGLNEDEGGSVAAFISEQWTLEFDLARRPALAVVAHQAIRLAKGSVGKTSQQIMDDAKAEVEAWQAQGKTADEVAVLIYEDLYKKRASKAETAQWLAQLFDAMTDDPAVFRAKLPQYLSEAVDHATSFGTVAAVAAPIEAAQNSSATNSSAR
jgi:putative ATP-dependent endonuclease of OLD family